MNKPSESEISMCFSLHATWRISRDAICQPLITKPILWHRGVIFSRASFNFTHWPGLAGSCVDTPSHVHFLASANPDCFCEFVQTHLMKNQTNENDEKSNMPSFLGSSSSSSFYLINPFSIPKFGYDCWYCRVWHVLYPYQNSCRSKNRNLMVE